MKIHFVANYKIEGIENYTSIEDVVAYCSSKTILGIDIETSEKFAKNTFSNETIYQPGLDPYLSKVIMLQIGDLDNIFVIDTRCIDISSLKSILECKSIIYVGHNLKFESKHLKYNFGVIFRNIWDTMIVEMILTNGLDLGYSLAKLSNRYLGIKPKEEKDLFSVEDENEEDSIFIDKSIRLGFIHIGDKLFTKEQVLYGADDIIYPLQIKAIQEKGKEDWNPLKLHQLENEFCLVLADIELKGINFNKEQWIKTAKENQVIYEKRLKTLNDYVVRSHPKFTSGPDLFNQNTKEFTCNIQWSSSQQVVEYFKFLGFCPKEKSKQTKKVEYSVGAKALAKILPKEFKDFLMKGVEKEIIDINTLVLAYLLLKQSEQAITTFGEDFIKYIHPITGRIHTSYKQILNTGRISSNKPNIQNIPQGEEYRKSFDAPPGYTLVDCDYSAQEAKCLAEVSGDPTMIDFFNLGDPIFKDDFHCMVATKMFRIIRNDPNLICLKKTHPEERNAAKSIGFKIAYGGSAYTLKDDFGVSEEVAEEFLEGYFTAFPSLRDDFELAKEKAVKLGYIEIDKVTHRKWFFKDFKYMKSLQEKAWKYYPESYKDLTPTQKENFKKQLKIDHPELSEIWSEFFQLKGKLERDALNFRIQGLAASQLKMAGVIMRRYILDNSLENQINIVSLIHDESVLEVIKERTEEGKKMVEEAMVTGGNKFCTKVKMSATACEGNYWYH